MLPIQTPIPWLTRLKGRSKRRSPGLHPMAYPILDGTAIKIELKRAIPTAVLTGTPKTTSSGMTRIGPPAPERAQIRPVTAPKASQNQRVIFCPGRLFFLSSFSSFRSKIEIPESSTTRYSIFLTIPSSMRRLSRTPPTAPTKLPI